MNPVPVAAARSTKSAMARGSEKVMKENWQTVGFAITIIDGKPQKFFIEYIMLGADSFDLTNKIPLAYRFAATESKSNLLKEYHVRVWEEVVGADVADVNPVVHARVIRYTLREIGREPGRSKIDFTSEEYERVAREPMLTAKDLKNEILKFIKQVNDEWPAEKISSEDILDNLNSSKKLVSDWLRHYIEKGYLLEGGDKPLRAGGKTVAFRINPEKEEEIRQMLSRREDSQLSSHVRTANVERHKYFQLVDTQSENEGKFVFVLMPFKESEFPQDIFDNVYAPVVMDTLGINCVKVDNDKFKNFIENKIYSHIIKSEFVIADLSTGNRNVIFEFGLALAFEKIIIPTYCGKYGGKDAKLSFDYEHFDTIFYNDYETLARELRETLSAYKHNKTA